MALRLRIVTERIPCGESISADFSRRDGGFQKCKCLGDSPAKFLRRNLAQLRFRIVQIENVHAFNSQIAAAAIELVGQVARRHAVAPRRDILRTENTRLDIFAREILVRVFRHLAVGSQESGLGANDDFVARKAPSRELPERGSDGTLAPLQAIVDRRIHHVDPAFDGRDDGAGVALVGLFIGFAEIRPDADG